MKKPDKAARKSGGANSGELAKQPHGGALKRGGNYGNKGGRPPNAIRGNFREILEAGLPQLLEFATDTRAKTKPVTCPECEHDFTITLSAVKPADQLKAIEMSAKYGLTKEGYDKDLVDHLWEATALVLEQITSGRKVSASVMCSLVPSNAYCHE